MNVLMSNWRFNLYLMANYWHILSSPLIRKPKLHLEPHVRLRGNKHYGIDTASWQFVSAWLRAFPKSRWTGSSRVCCWWNALDVFSGALELWHLGFSTGAVKWYRCRTMGMDGIFGKVGFPFLYNCSSVWKFVCRAKPRCSMEIVHEHVVRPVLRLTQLYRRDFNYWAGLVLSAWSGPVFCKSIK